MLLSVVGKFVYSVICRIVLVIFVCVSLMLSFVVMCIFNCGVVLFSVVSVVMVVILCLCSVRLGW